MGRKCTGLGRGEWIEFRFPDQERVRLICVVDGYALSWDLYQKNPRVRSFDLSNGDGETLAVAPLNDAATADHFAYFQEVRTPPDLPAIGVLRLSIASIYAGLGRQRYPDTS